MTLDVTIGKIVNAKPYKGKGTIRVKIAEKYQRNPDHKKAPDVEECPDGHNGFVSKYTIYPTRSIRSGSSGFWDFFRKFLPDLYDEMREHPESNDTDIAFLKPVIEKIDRLPDLVDWEMSDDECERGHAARMDWFRYWCDVAVELYGDEAAIKFS